MSTFHIDLVAGNDANSGADWANAWLTPTNGATAARITAGDVIKLSKTGGVTSLGNATWNNKSKTVTLATAQTQTIDNCESNWTIANSAVHAKQSGTYNKQGSYNIRIQAPASTATNTLYAYYNIADTDLSAYKLISFWWANNTAIAAGNWKICLCSDDAGTTVVDSFLIPAIASTSRMMPLTIAKDGGGYLGNDIKSIALYSGSVAPTGSTYVYFDHFIACLENGLNLQSLISKNSSEINSVTEPWHGIQSIDGTTILLDDDTASISSAGKGYHGATETVTTYFRETFKTPLAASQGAQIFILNEGGTAAGGYITFSGGWNTSTNLQDGETFIDGLSGWGYGIYHYQAGGFLILEHISTVRYSSGFYIAVTNNLRMNNCSASNGAVGINSQINYYVRLENCVANNTTTSNYQIQHTFNSKIINCYSYNSVRAINMPYSGGNNIINLITKNNSATVSGNSINTTFYNLENTDDTAFTSIGTFYTGYAFHKYRGVEGDNFSIMYGATYGFIAQQTTRHTESGYAWEMRTIGTSCSINHPLEMPLARVLVEAGTQKRIKVWCKKGHATNVGAALLVPEYQNSWITTESTAVKADDTDWEELSIVINVTETGVIEVYARAWYITGSSTSVYWDDFSSETLA